MAADKADAPMAKVEQPPRHLEGGEPIIHTYTTQIAPKPTGGYADRRDPGGLQGFAHHGGLAERRRQHDAGDGAVDQLLHSRAL